MEYSHDLPSSVWKKHLGYSQYTDSSSYAACRGTIKHEHLADIRVHKLYQPRPLNISSSTMGIWRCFNVNSYVDVLTRRRRTVGWAAASCRTCWSNITRSAARTRPTPPACLTAPASTGRGASSPPLPPTPPCITCSLTITQRGQGSWGASTRWRWLSLCTICTRSWWVTLECHSVVDTSLLNDEVSTEVAV